MATINEDVMIYVKKQINKRVYLRDAGPNKSAGECWDLAEAALTEAGAKTSTDIMGKIGANDDYQWGTKIALGAVKKGDILQFSKYRCDWTEVVTDSDGEFTNTNFITAPHHTAIVASVMKKGAVEVYHQNFAKNKNVHKTTFQLRNEKYELNKTKYDFKVTGKVTAYRPEEKLEKKEKKKKLEKAG